ncbi:MAG TPA: hypothetical protein VMM38_08040 [Aridibacter sp.]|nr:hypothetical protein [Aridibacter sp.]
MNLGKPITHKSHKVETILSAFLLASVFLSIATKSIDAYNHRVAENERLKACEVTGDENYCFTVYKISSQRDGLFRLVILVCAVPLLILVRKHRSPFVQWLLLLGLHSVFAVWAIGKWLTISSNENQSLYLIANGTNVFDFVSLGLAVSLTAVKIIGWRRAAFDD